MTNLNRPSLLPNRQISEDEIDAIQRANRGDLQVCRGGSCRQGRQPCTTPDACRLSEDSDFGALEGLTRGIGYIALAWAVVGVLVFLVWWTL